MDTLGVCGWVVDLRGNTGGGLWPMVAGIGPVLGNGHAGYFTGPDGRRRGWGYQDGNAWLDDFGIVAFIVDPYELRPWPF